MATRYPTAPTIALLALVLALIAAPADARKARNTGWETLRTFCVVAEGFGLRVKACRGFR
jgi:hypothetical protein